MGHYNATATVTSAGLQAPSGKVNFVDQSNANLALGSATLGSPSAPLAFGPSATYPVGGNPLAIVAGDFNNDGIVDLVVNDLSGLSILLGNADGTFQPRTSISAQHVFSLAVADFNSDGFLDVVVDGDGVSIYLGHGDGTFAAPQSVPPPGLSGGATVGDFNGDGIPDLAIAVNGIDIALGRGDGTFQPVVLYPDASGPAAIAIADVNGDGIADLVVANGSDVTVSVLLGNSDGTFQPQVEYSSGPQGTYADAVALGDFNHDGFPDIALGATGGGFTVLLNNGNGTFGSPTAYNLAKHNTQIALADMNADGNPDVVLIPTSEPGIYVVPGNSNGTFGTPVFLSPTTFTDSFAGVAVADFNGDGLLDFATTDETNNGLVWLNALVQTSTRNGRNIGSWRRLAQRRRFLAGRRRASGQHLRSTGSTGRIDPGYPDAHGLHQSCTVRRHRDPHRHRTARFRGQLLRGRIGGVLRQRQPDRDAAGFLRRQPRC